MSDGTISSAGCLGRWHEQHEQAQADHAFDEAGQEKHADNQPSVLAWLGHLRGKPQGAKALASTPRLAPAQSARCPNGWQRGD
jgi:hypothetical protein